MKTRIFAALFTLVLLLNLLSGVTYAKGADGRIKTIERYRDLELIESLGIPEGTIEEVPQEKRSYIVKIGNDIEDKIVVQRNDSSGISLEITEGGKRDQVDIKNGNLYIDGTLVTVERENHSAPQLFGRIYRSTKSFSPYRGLRSSDYNHFLAQNKANVRLGKRLDQITAASLAYALSFLPMYLGIGRDLITYAAQIIDALAHKNTTDHLWYTCITYTNSPEDYKYITRYYANSRYTGGHSLVTSYEHFFIY